MISTLARKSWYLVLPAVLLLGAVGYRAGDRGGAPVDQDSAAAAIAVNAAPGLPATASAALPTPQRERAGAVGPGLPLDLRAGFEATSDLYAYAQQLYQAGDAGNAEATWLLSRVYDYCAGYARDPAGYALDSQQLAGLGRDAVPGLARARARVGRRCAGFTAADGLGRGLTLAQRKQAADAGNLAAEASLLAAGQPLYADAGYRRGLVERVVASQDPEAFLALSPAMGASAASDEAYRGLVAGDQFSQLAWQLAACELGLACGPDSVLMNSYCANGGVCSRDPGQDFMTFVFDAAVPRQGVEKMNELVSRLRRRHGVAR
ncbi:hypothetical protein [Stenotrophomonas sp. YIM B06876]|uniref:hypothetical protein n=1 Tax=Stenotrophomonas sp. YIM B06876 TaxID=3060211 RepID=UPI0027396D25|nr:hypothetical protein [Stenotrophomonas sp. YIM B06876]